MAPANWPDWVALEQLVQRENFGDGGTLFNALRQKTIQASPEEVEEVACHAPLTWAFLIGFGGKKAMYRKQVLAVVQRLTECPQWVAAWESHTELHAKVKDLHEDLQAAFAVQHKSIAQAVAPAALKSVAAVKAEERPEVLKADTVKQKLVDDIKSQQQDAPFADLSPSPALTVEPEVSNPLDALQEGIDAVVALDDDAKLDTGGKKALDKLRIGCFECAGKEENFCNEASQATQVFAFLFRFLKRKPDEIKAVAEVINQLMASPSWEAVFDASIPLQDSVMQLQEDTQAALGLQHEKLLQVVSRSARQRAEKGDLTEEVKEVAPLMQSIRPAAFSKAVSSANCEVAPAVETASSVSSATRMETASKIGTQQHSNSQIEKPGDGYSKSERGPSLMSVHGLAEPEPEALVASGSRSAKQEFDSKLASPAVSSKATEIDSGAWKSARTPQGHVYYFNSVTRNSQWERPDALGGPIEFQVGDEVEVWSNANACWGRGKVVILDRLGGKVTCEFTLPSGASAKKELPSQHKDLRHVDKSLPTESFSAEESELYRRLFESLEGDQGLLRKSKVVACFLRRSGANNHTLRQLWSVANPSLKEDLDLDDFSRCCRLVAHCQDAGMDSEMISAGERPLRVWLRTSALFTRPKVLPIFNT